MKNKSTDAISKTKSRRDNERTRQEQRANGRLSKTFRTLRG